ncbi:MAG TPA: isoprenylcysteine carboxylmethyltransferase family protein [Bacteroidales bacterium]|nr:isoprenylcysteine carboxylmethyltransferase family protein [Bacteroidales bacterium]
MISLLLRNLVYLILLPGIVAGLVPYLIAGKRFSAVLHSGMSFQQTIGIFLFAVGLTVLLDCILRFALTGRGTLSPSDPTKKLVQTGLYRFSRNPMYLGVLAILAGEAVFTGSSGLWIYLLGVFAAFYLFIIFAEEPGLRKDFGEEYNAYCKRVNRWF